MKERILVVDDEDAIRELLKTYLEIFGYVVLTASNSIETFRIVRDQTPQLVIMDLHLTDMDGLELLERVKEMDPEMPVIMLTGMGFDMNLHKAALAKGATAFSMKATPLDQLRAKIEMALNSRTAVVG